jgi:hypothetical protein
MSLRPHQIGTHDRLTAAKEALAAPTAMSSSPDPVRSGQILLPPRCHEDQNARPPIWRSGL